MVRRLAMVVLLGGVMGASSAHAQSMGEMVATTGVHNTLASSGTMNPKGTIGTVQRAVGAAAATKQAQLDGATGGGGPVGWGGKGGGTGGWATHASGGTSGWAVAGAGWTTASTGWATAAGASAWASGGWGTSAH